MLPHLILLFFSLCGAANADSVPTKDQFCVSGCQTALSLTQFAGTPGAEAGYYLYACQNVLLVSSVYACSRRYCPSSEIATGINYLNETCMLYGGITILDYNIISNTSDTGLPTISISNTAVINSTSIPDQDLFELGLRTFVIWYSEQDAHLRYAEAMFMFWGCVIFLGIIHNFATTLLPAKLTRSSLSSRLQGFIGLPSLFGHSCDQPLHDLCTIPPRLESLVVIGYVFLNIILAAQTYVVFPNNLYFEDIQQQLWRYIADRAGYLAYANLPVLWLFAIRNNILIELTGWSFPTFNRFHRWVARVATLEAVVHSVAYTVYTFLSAGFEGYSLSWVELYWWTGCIATISMSLLLGASFIWVRIRFYNLFLAMHIGLAIMMLVTLFYHTSIFYGQYDGFLWACVAIWAFDRAVRYLRIAVNLFSTASRTVCDVEYDTAAGLVRIDLTETAGPWIKARSGCSVFVYVYNQVRFWESHPFTVTTWLEEDSVSISPGEAVSTDKTLEQCNVTIASLSSPSTRRQTRYSLLVRPHQGFTSRLASWSLSPFILGPPRFLFEGPYGHAPSFRNDTTQVVFIIGGSGISVAISSIYSLLQRSRVPHIHLIWAIRSGELLDSVLARELQKAANSIQIDAYITRAPVEEGVHTVSKVPVDRLRTPLRCAVHSGRPDIESAIAQATQHQSGLLHIVACGPASMMDDTRSAVSHELQRGNKDLQLSLERFAW